MKDDYKLQLAIYALLFKQEDVLIIFKGEKEKMACKEFVEETCKSYPECRGCRANVKGNNMTQPCGDGTARAYADNHNPLSMVRLGPNHDVWRVTGKIVDRLHEFEKLGYEPEQLKDMMELFRVYRRAAYSQDAAEALYHLYKAAGNVELSYCNDIRDMYPTTLFTKEGFAMRYTTDEEFRKDVMKTIEGALEKAKNPRLKNIVRDLVNEKIVKEITKPFHIARPFDCPKIYVTTSSSIKDDEFMKKVKEAMKAMSRDFTYRAPNTFTIDELDSADSNRTRDIYNYILYDTKVTNEICRVLQNKKETEQNMSVIKKSGDRPWGWGVPGIKRVLFNNPATIVFWADGDKTVVKCQNGEPYDPEKGLAMAISKKALGNGNKWYDEFKKQLENCENGFHMHSAAWCGYNRLVNALHDKKATKADLVAAMEEAVGYFGEELQ